MKVLNCHIKEHNQLSHIISVLPRQLPPQLIFWRICHVNHISQCKVDIAQLKIPLDLLVLDNQLLLLSHPRSHTPFILSSNREDSLPQSSPCRHPNNKGTTIFLPPLLSSHYKQNSA